MSGAHVSRSQDARSMRQLIGATLRHYRQKQDRTLREVAADANVSLGYLSEIERGSKEPSLATLIAITEALNLSFTFEMTD